MSQGSPRLPYTLARAAPFLEPQLFGIFPEQARRIELGAGKARDFAILAPEAGELQTGCIVRVGEERWAVSEALCRLWNAQPQDVLHAAYDSVREQMRGARLTFESIARGTYRVSDPRMPAMLFRMTSPADQLSVIGDVVLLAPTWNTAFLTGSDDIAGLLSIVEQAREAIAQHPLDVVSARPVVFRDGRQPFEWPAAADVRRRDRRTAALLVAAVDALEADFAVACEAVRDDIRDEGLPLRRALGSSTTDEAVLEGWTRLSLAFGADAQTAAQVREAAADTLEYFDAHRAEIEDVERTEFRAHHVLAQALERQGSVVWVSRKSDPRLVAMDASATPAARAAGAVITLEEEYDGAVELAEDVSSRMVALGVDVVALGEIGSDLGLVFYAAAMRSEVSAADRAIGDAMLLTYV